ncbi:MAG: DUF401 family protein [Desulfurococcales archaeon]|nr:DUF401 family protein [Desulfurococcales archaeon]
MDGGKRYTAYTMPTGGDDVEVKLVDPLLAFVLGYTLLVIASSKGVRVYYSLMILITVFFAFSMSIGELEKSFLDLYSWNDIRVFVYIFLSMLLAGIMKAQGKLDGLVESTSGVSCRFSLLGVPAIIGLMPMPGGALVSAIALKDKFFKEARLSPEDATYINYWFRHLWVPVWPLFQSVVITAAVLAIDPLDVVSHTWPGTIGAIIGGLVIAYFVLRGLACGRQNIENPLRLFLASFWPLLLLAVLFLLSRTKMNSVISLIIPWYSDEPMLVSLVIVVLLTVLSKIPDRKGWIEALKLATKPTIHIVLFESLLFKNMIINSGAANSTASLLDKDLLPLAAMLYIIPFILGLAAGGENFFASTAIPLLAAVIGVGSSVNWGYLSVAYLGGFLGVMASPVHLCLALTLTYFNARFSPVIVKVLASVMLATLVGGVLIYMLYW